MTVAITGATGFLGQHLVSALLDHGARVRVLARRETADMPWSGRVEIVRGDLADRDALKKFVTGATALVHVAGLVAARNRAEFLRANRDGARMVAEAAMQNAPDARFILVSSLAAREPGLSPYAASKQAGEACVQSVYAETPGQLVIVRPPVVYGPGDRATLSLFRAARWPLVPLFGDGRSAVIHAADAAHTLARLARGDGVAGTWALADANPAGYSLAELTAEAARAQGGNPRFARLPGAALLAAGAASGAWSRLRGTASVFGPGKAREILHGDWSVPVEQLPPASVHAPRIRLAEGFRDTVAWYRAHDWLR
jgi:nucleoside-diphosphate-sugar epimerase